MANLSLPDGSTVVVPDEQLPAVLASGKFGAPTAPVLMLDDQGMPTDVDPQSVQAALAKGYKPTDEATAAHAKALQEAGQHPGAAFLEGVGRGLVPGFPTVEAALGAAKPGQQLRAEANPIAAPAGQVTGNLLQLGAVGAATGGLGDIGEVGELGAKAAAEGFGEGAAEVAGAGGEAGAEAAPAAASDALAAATPKVAPGLLDPTAMAKSAAVFGAQGLSNEANEEDLGDHGFNAEALAAAGAGGALLGAVSEPLLGVAGRALSKTITATTDAVAKASDVAAKVLGKATVAARPDIVAQAGREGLETAMRNTYEAAQAGVPNAGREMTSEGARAMADTTNDALEKGFDLRMETEEQHLPAAIEKTMGPQPFSKAAAEVDKFMANVVNPAMVRMEQGLEKGELQYRKPIADLQRLVTKFQEARGEAETTPELWNAVRDLRKGIDAGQKYGKVLTATEADTINAIEQGVQTPLRQLLTNKEAWGRAGADAVTAFNEATTASINAEKAVLTKLGGKDLIDQSVRPQKEIKAAKLKTLFNGADNVSQDDARAVLQKYLESTNAYADMAKELSETGGSSLDVDELQGLLKDIYDRKAAGEAGAMLQRRQPWEQGGKQLHLLAAVSGHPMVGAAIRTASGLVDTVRNPTAALQALGAIKRVAQKYQAGIANGAARFLSGAVKPVATAGAVGAVTTRHFGAGRSTQTRGSTNERRADQVQNLMANPQLLANALERTTAGIAEAAPMHTMALHQTSMAKLRTIAAAIPQDPNPHMLGATKYVPNPEEVAHFSRVYSAVAKPVETLYAGMQSGSLTPDEVQAVAQSAPKTLAAIQSALQDDIVDHPGRSYSIAQKTMLSLVLGQPVAPEVSPAQVMFQQQTFAAAAAPPPQQQQPEKMRASGLDKLNVAQSTATPQQARSMERQS